MFLINLLVSIFIRQLFRILNGFQRLLGKFTDIHKSCLPSNHNYL